MNNNVTVSHFWPWRQCKKSHLLTEVGFTSSSESLPKRQRSNLLLKYASQIWCGLPLDMKKKEV